MEFNRECADHVYEVVSKMDDGEAQAFALFAADDIWRHDVARNSRYLAWRLTKDEEARTEEVAKSLLDHLEHGGDPQEAVAVAAAVSVAKAEGDWWKFQERDRAGRFGRMTRSEYKARVKEIKAQTGADAASMKAGLIAERKANPEFRRAERYDRERRVYNQTASTGRLVSRGAKDFAEGQTRPRNNESGATDTFNRLQSGGQVVQGIGAATGNPKLAAAGALANYAGAFGPEAEKVIGPSIRRTAYRYRGTERTPDKNLNSLIKANSQAIMRHQGRPSTDAPDAAEKTFASERAAIQYLRGDYKDDGEKGKSRIPSSGLAELHRKSGKITPSEGILIDANGNVVSQSVGFAEDHYLPFNLKNMAALKGGSYVRTRESGGLTTEDIYAGLMSGARSMTVVSNSGTFTLDFDDALRGGRRYSDKARSMVDRYQATLDAVQSEQVRRMPISAREKAEVRDEVDREVEALGLEPWEYTPEMKERYYNQKILERRSNPQLTAPEYEAIERESWKGLNRNRPSDQDLASQQRIERQLQRRALAAKGQPNYKLDGEGYKAALDALQEQFPYYVQSVKVQANHDDPESFNDSVDLGYVKPRFNRPTAARVGFYGEGVGSPKRSAEETGYQNWRARRDGRLQAVAEEPQEKPAERVVAPGQARAETAHQDSVKAAEAQRTQTTAHAANWWIDALGAGNTPLSHHLSVMAQMPVEQRVGYAHEHGDAIRGEIDSFKALARSQGKEASFSTAPEIIYNPPAPPRSTNPGGTTPAEVAGRLAPVFNESHADLLQEAERRNPGLLRQMDAQSDQALLKTAEVYDQHHRENPNVQGWNWQKSADTLRAYVAFRAAEKARTQTAVS